MSRAADDGDFAGGFIENVAWLFGLLVSVLPIRWGEDLVL